MSELLLSVLGVALVGLLDVLGVVAHALGDHHLVPAGSCLHVIPAHPH